MLNMSFQLDALVNIPGVTVEMRSYQDHEVCMTLGLLMDGYICPHYQNYTQEMH